MSKPRIQVSTVGSYPVPDWLAAYPNEQSLVDATRVIFATQRDAGVDLPTDGDPKIVSGALRPMGGGGRRAASSAISCLIKASW